jgi:hypothetical protein
MIDLRQDLKESLENKNYDKASEILDEMIAIKKAINQNLVSLIEIKNQVLELVNEYLESETVGE